VVAENDKGKTVAIAATGTLASKMGEMLEKPKESWEAGALDVEGERAPEKGPILGVVWFCLTFTAVIVIAAVADYNVLYLMIGYRTIIAFAGYLIMQIGLWHAENKWDEEGSQAWLEAAGADAGSAPDVLEAKKFGDVVIPADKLKAAFPVPWGFLIGWWVWGISYLFPIDGTLDIDPTVYGIIALVVCLGVSFDASIPMSDAVMMRKDKKKKMLSVVFLLGWITLGIMSALDVTKQLDDRDCKGFVKIPSYCTLNSDLEGVVKNYDHAGVWILCMLGPFTVILSQKILFGARKMGTLWEASGKPNFHPIVYNMGGPLFVWGWFLFLMGTSSIPGDFTDLAALAKLAGDDDANYLQQDGGPYNIPLFLNWRTALSFIGGCAMVPVVGFLDFSHDEDGPWCGENNETPKAIFKKWWLGTDGTYFGLFLESPWPFVMAWSLFGFSCFLDINNDFDVGWQEVAILINCILQGVDAGILIQQNLYGGNLAGKTKFSLPFAILFILLAVNIGTSWGYRAMALSLPGAILIILGQKTVFGARKRGDYSMQNVGEANPYNKVLVYTWGEVFFMMGWILICWGMAMP